MTDVQMPINSQVMRKYESYTERIIESSNLSRLNTSKSLIPFDPKAQTDR